MTFDLSLPVSGEHAIFLAQNKRISLASKLFIFAILRTEFFQYYFLILHSISHNIIQIIYSKLSILLRS